jgi:enolase-phosphatase E1
MKQDTESYRKIATVIGLPASEIVFLSDIEGELNAAREAGFQTILLDRDGKAPASSHQCVNSFAEISF